MFDTKADFIINLIDRINDIINEVNDGAEDLDLDISVFEEALALAEQLRDELESLIDE